MLFATAAILALGGTVTIVIAFTHHLASLAITTPMFALSLAFAQAGAQLQQDAGNDTVVGRLILAVYVSPLSSTHADIIKELVRLCLALLYAMPPTSTAQRASLRPHPFEKPATGVL